MIVLCPKCKTRYKVDENKIGDQGQRLRCSKCQTVFRVKKPARQQAQPPASPQPPRQQQAQPPASPQPPRQQQDQPQPEQPQPEQPQQQAQPQPEQPQQPAPKPPPKKPLSVGPYKPKVESKGTLVVADADDTFLRHVARLLLQNGYTLYLAHDGAVAMELIKTKKPRVAIVDVALPKVYGFEITEMVKGDETLKQQTKIILLGEVYEKERYRRKPQSLYGADEYIEKHHDGPEVLEKVGSLISGKPAPPEEHKPEAQPEPPPRPEDAPGPQPSKAPQAPPAPPEPAAAAKPPAPPEPPSPRQPQAEAAEPPAPAPPEPKAPPAPPQAPAAPAAPQAPAAQAPAGPPPAPDDPTHQKAARLARTIISDITLYNPDMVEKAVKEGNVYELLAKDIEDGLKHFNSRVPEEVRNQRDYFKEAMDAMIQKKRSELGLS